MRIGSGRDRIIGIVTLLILIASPESFSPQSGRNQQSPSVEKARDFSPGGAVRVENLSGGIRLETWSRPRLEMRVRPTAGAHAFRPSLVQWEASATQVLCRIPAVPHLRLEIWMRVPHETSLEVKTADGAIEISGEPGPASVETTGGRVTVRLPPNFDAEISFSTEQGTIYSELPVLVRGAFQAHALAGQLGRGGRALTIKTRRGDIHLLALPPTARPPADRARSEPSAMPKPEVGEAPRDREIARGSREASDPLEEAPPRPTTRPPRSRAEEMGEVITLEAPLVNVNVSVTDEFGRAVTDLKKEEFLIFEDGVEQQITHFAPVSAPFDLALLLDVSGSTEGKLHVIKRAAQAFVDMIGPDDRLAVFAFTRRVYPVAPFTNNRLLLKESIRAIRGGGGTAFYDALWHVLTEVERRSNRRRAIVVMTDGVDNSIRQPWLFPSEHTFEELLRRVQESDVIVYPIYLDTEYEMVVRQRRESPMSYALARRQLLALAEHSGGTLYRAEEVEDLEGVYQRVAEELRTIYSLAYSPQNAARDGTWRTIRVKVLRPGLRVRARHGYYAR